MKVTGPQGNLGRRVPENGKNSSRHASGPTIVMYRIAVPSAQTPVGAILDKFVPVKLPRAPRARTFASEWQWMAASRPIPSQTEACAHHSSSPSGTSSPRPASVSCAGAVCSLGISNLIRADVGGDSCLYCKHCCFHSLPSLDHSLIAAVLQRIPACA